MRASHFPIGARIAIGVVLPVVGFAVFMSLFVAAQFAQSARMEKVMEVAIFNRHISALVHEVQRERGMSAGFIASNGQGAFVGQLREQQARTDQALSTYNAAIGQLHRDQLTEGMNAHLDMVSAELTHLPDIRDRVRALPEAAGPVVSGYTAMVNELIELIAEETHAAEGGHGTVEIMVGFLNLIHAKESAGLERAVGAGAFSRGEITPAQHTRAIELASEQNAYFKEFKELMGPYWAGQLEEALSRPESQGVETARLALVSAGYGSRLSGISGPEWFAASSERIEVLKSLERQVSELLIETAEQGLSQAQSSSRWALALGLLGLLATLTLSSAMVLSVVRPMSKITNSITQLAEGATNVDIEGVDRRDEVGSIARAATTFLNRLIDREESTKRTSRLERTSMRERARLLEDMSHKVKEATQVSVGGIADQAATLRQRSESIEGVLAQAGQNARDANAATTTTLEQTDRASELASELTRAIAEVTEQITRGDQLARSAMSKADTSRDGVESLKQAADQIGDFIGIITGLAEQTNLLALNATIEAARAGEAGKGFAVVASEVKSLAEQTNKSTTEIAERVSAIQSRTEETVGSIGEVADAIDSLGEVTAAVAAAMEEQRAATTSFAGFMETNQQALTEVAVKIDGVTAAAQSSATDAVQMAEMVAQMAETANDASHAIPAIVDEAIEAAETREKDPRFEVEAPVHVIINGQRSAAMVTNISMNGLQLRGATGQKGQSIKIEGEGALFEGEIAGTRDNQLGIRFKRPITLLSLQEYAVRYLNDAA